jgi:hypothetical protein
LISFVNDEQQTHYLKDKISQFKSKVEKNSQMIPKDDQNPSKPEGFIIASGTSGFDTVTLEEKYLLTLAHFML